MRNPLKRRKPQADPEVLTMSNDEFEALVISDLRDFTDSFVAGMTQAMEERVQQFSTEAQLDVYLTDAFSDAARLPREAAVRRLQQAVQSLLDVGYTNGQIRASIVRLYDRLPG